MGYALLAYSSGTIEGIQALFCYLIIYMLSGICLWTIFLMIKFKNNFNGKNKTSGLFTIILSNIFVKFIRT